MLTSRCPGGGAGVFLLRPLWCCVSWLRAVCSAAAYRGGSPLCMWGGAPSLYIGGGSPLSIYMGGPLYIHGGTPLYAYMQYTKGYVPPLRG